MSIRPLSDYDLLPIYIRVADDLRSKLGTEGFEIGSYLPGEHEIATQYKLSRGTIRRALGILETEKLLSRQPGRGTLILPPVALEHGKRSKVAVVWTMVRWMGMEMFSALEDYLSAANCDILFSSSKHDHRQETEILAGLLESDVDAIVLYSTGHPDSHPIIQLLQDQGKPVILLDRFVQDQINTLSWVTSDNEQGSYQITRHLIELGHKRIGMGILTPEHHHERISTIIERERGYLKAINEAGLDNFFIIKEFGITDETSAAYGQELIDFIVSYQPTALFFHNDVSAYRMYEVLIQHGIRVPQDISIAGFDGLDLFDDLLSFDFTTVKQDFTKLGHEAGKLVLLLIRNPDLQPRQIRLPVKLRVGSTTAPPRKDADSQKLLFRLLETD